MSLSTEEIGTIQKAGVALHHASETIAQTLRRQADRMVRQLAQQPFQGESAAALEQFKALAGLSQSLKQQEQDLRALYVGAERLLHGATAPAKSAPARTKPKPKSKSTAKPVERMPKAGVAALSPNDEKVLQYFRSVLGTDSWTALTGSVIAAGSGLPKGSVGVSVNRVLASGAVRRGPGSTFQLVDVVPA